MRYLILGTLTTVLLGSYYYFTRRVQDSLNEDDVAVDVDLNLSDVVNDVVSNEKTQTETQTETETETEETSNEIEALIEAQVQEILEKLINDSIDVSDRKKFLLQKKVELNELLEKINMVQMALKSLH
jgi:small-conductance mechanosensitive channel